MYVLILLKALLFCDDTINMYDIKREKKVLIKKSVLICWARDTIYIVQ